jgi:hypothetical protein
MDMKRVCLLFLSVLTLLLTGCTEAPKDLPVYGQEVLELTDAPEASEIYQNTKYISLDELWLGDMPSDEGLTVFWGRGLDESIIEDAIARPGKDGVDEIVPLPQLGGVQETTYMVLYFKSGNAVDMQYIGASFEEEVSAEARERFVTANLTAEARDRAVIAFINQLVENPDSALHRPNKEVFAERSAVCAYLYDTTTHIALYEEKGKTYPVVAYRQEAAYEAVSIPDSLEHVDTYILRTRITVIPGSCLAVPEGFHNAEYGKKIAIRGVRTSFDNIHAAAGDRYVSLRPFGNADDVSGRVFECCGETFSFKSPDLLTKIGHISRFAAEGSSFVEFLASRQGRIAAEPFSCATQMYMQSGGDTLLTRIAAGVTYRLGGEDRFVESEREIFFSKN